MNLKQLSAFGILSFASTVASAAIIDFEGLSAGTIVDNEYQLSHGVTINGHNSFVNKDGLAVVFDSNHITGGDTDLESPFSNTTLGALNPGKILIIHEWRANTPNRACNATTCNNPDDEGRRPAGYFDINFAQAVTLNSIDFFDIEKAETNFQHAIQFFGLNDIEIMPNTFFTQNTGGDNTWARQNFNVSDVSRVRISFGGSGAIDNINYTVQVPEPSSLLLLSLGLIGLGALRKQKA